MGRIFVMGLDGATWRVLDRFINLGVMPTLKKLKEEAAWGILKSTLPPLSAPAWCTFLTGCNPGKHGIIDFYHFNEKYEPEPLGFYDLEIWPFFKELEDIEIGIVNVPFTYPPPDVNGFIISGFMRPEGEKSYTYPSDLKNEIEKLGPYSTDPYDKYAYRSEDLLKQILFWIEFREKIKEKLLKDFSPQIYIQVFQETDVLGHFFYDILDNNSESFKEKEWNRYKNLIIKIFSELDSTIKKWINELKEEDLLILMSDHGFKPVYHTFSIINFLKEKEFIQTAGKKEKFKLGKKFISFLSRRNILRKYFSKIMPHFARERLKRKVDQFIGEKINWQDSDIFIPASTSYGIYIQNKKDKEKIKKKLIEDLKNLEFENIKVLKEIWEKEKIYKGPFLNKLPDIVFDLNEGFAISLKTTSESLFEKPTEVYNGYHHQDGIFVFYKKNFKIKGKISKSLKLEDFAPIFFSFFKKSVPSYMDGKPPEFLFEKHKIRIEKKELPLKKKETYSDEEKKEMLKKLQHLGYA